mmetsp:Transcript_11048/g.25131  ORF Transcript_11048/g.25131 Transcript_11048/m.25131 type:complete len:241 (-) Transcript_11048:454-1176(-)
MLCHVSTCATRYASVWSSRHVVSVHCRCTDERAPESSAQSTPSRCASESRVVESAARVSATCCFAATFFSCTTLSAVSERSLGSKSKSGSAASVNGSPTAVESCVASEEATCITLRVAATVSPRAAAWLSSLVSRAVRYSRVSSTLRSGGQGSVRTPRSCSSSAKCCALSTTHLASSSRRRLSSIKCCCCSFTMPCRVSFNALRSRQSTTQPEPWAATCDTTGWVAGSTCRDPGALPSPI